MTPWTERSGRFSPLKAITFAGTLLPGLVLAWWLWADAMGAKPVNAAIHYTGEWAVRFLLLSLAVTPLRRIGNWPRLILVRRMLGLAALGYVVIHLALYAVEQNYDLPKVASEIALRFYLTIGFVALIGLIALGATSTDAAIRRLGKRWPLLHRIVYAIAVLALLHHFLQAKADVSQATLMTGVFVLLMLYRLMHKAGIRLTPLPLAGAAVVATAMTMGIEYLWYALATGIDPARVFLANFDFSYTVRPSWWVGAAGLVLAGVALVRRKTGQHRGRKRGDRLVNEAAAVSGRG